MSDHSLLKKFLIDVREERYWRGMRKSDFRMRKPWWIAKTGWRRQRALVPNSSWTGHLKWGSAEKKGLEGEDNLWYTFSQKINLESYVISENKSDISNSYEFHGRGEYFDLCLSLCKMWHIWMSVGELVFEFKFWKISLPKKVGIAIL